MLYVHPSVCLSIWHTVYSSVYHGDNNKLSACKVTECSIVDNKLVKLKKDLIT